MEICSVRPWTMNALIADSYSTHYATGDAGGFAARDGQTGGAENTGAVFLLGDAAHQFPPAGGFGLNTGMQVQCNGAKSRPSAEPGRIVSTRVDTVVGGTGAKPKPKPPKYRAQTEFSSTTESLYNKDKQLKQQIHERPSQVADGLENDYLLRFRKRVRCCLLALRQHGSR